MQKVVGNFPDTNDENVIRWFERFKENDCRKREQVAHGKVICRKGYLKVFAIFGFIDINEDLV